MKRKPTQSFLKSAGTCAGAVAVSAMLLTGCGPFRPSFNFGGTVYGPPPEEPTSTAAPWYAYDPADNQNQDVYGPPPDDDYDPRDDEAEPVYGPPDDWGDDSFEW